MYNENKANIKVPQTSSPDYSSKENINIFMHFMKKRKENREKSSLTHII